MKTIICAATIILSAPNLSFAQLTKPQQQSVVFLHAPGACDGTGFFISGSTIVTASHVAQTAKLEVWIGGKRYYATVSKRNDAIDYCELRISGYVCPRPLKTAAPKLEEKSWTYGFPESRKLSGSSGQIGFDYILGAWTSGATAEMGMSGGPVVNSSGKVIGIISKRGWGGCTVFTTTKEAGL